MQFTFQVDRADAIRHGSNKHGQVAIEIDVATLSQEDRDTLAILTMPDTGVVRKWGNYSGHVQRGLSLTAYAATQDALFEAIARSREEATAEAAAYKAKKESEEREEQAKKDALVAKILPAPVDELIVYDNLRFDGKWGRFTKPINAFRDPIDDERLRPRLAEVLAECERRNVAIVAQMEAIEREKAKEEAEAEAKRTVATTKLKEWAAVHGSELLKARIKHGFDSWFTLARDEYADTVFAVVASGLTPANDLSTEEYTTHTEDRKSPTLAEIKALETAIAVVFPDPIGGTTVAIELDRIKYTAKEPEYGCDDDDNAIERTELEITVYVAGIASWAAVGFFLIAE